MISVYAHDGSTYDDDDDDDDEQNKSYETC